MQGNLPVSFGKGVTEKALGRDLAGALLHSEEGGGKRAARAVPRQPVLATWNVCS